MKFYLFEIKTKKNSDMRKDIRHLASIGRDEMLKMESNDIAVEKHEYESRISADVVDIVEGRSDNLPGRVRNGENEDLPIDEGDKISQQTMAMFAPFGKRHFLICQYNHYGAKAGKIAAYLGGDDPEAYSLVPVIRKDVMERFGQSDGVTYFRVKIVSSKGMGNLAKGTSLTRTLDEGMEHDAGAIDIAYGNGGDKRGGILKGIKEMVPRFLRRGGDGIHALEAKVKIDNQVEMLDLLEHRVVYEVGEASLVRTPGQRYTHKSRKKAIIAAFNSSDFQKHMK